MINQEISRIFRDIADILEIRGENVFRIRAYQRAAEVIDGLGENVLLRAIERDTLTDIPSIGKDLNDKIREYASTGAIGYYEKLKKSIPSGLLELLAIPTIGPKTAKLLYEQRAITSLASLEKAIARGHLADLPGIKAKTIENITKGIALVKRKKERMNLGQAVNVAQEFVARLRRLPEVQRIEPAGSLRRRKPTVRDIDLLMTSRSPAKVMDAFVTLPMVKEVLAKGPTKSSILTAEDVQVDCRVESAASFGAAMVYFTGSKDFNIRLRTIAQKKGLKINEYGVFKGERCIAGKTEEEVFGCLSMSYIDPEMRENAGEIELAMKHALPRLLAQEDIKGDFHVHSSWSDGIATIQEMAAACMKRGYSSVAITDHSQGLKVAHGLEPARLRKKKKEVERLNARLKGIRILLGTEVDIGSDGTLDYPDSILKECDVVIAAIHAGFKQSREQLTRRLIRAAKHPRVSIIAHPTGVLWGSRDPYEIDLDELFHVAREENTSLEINAFPDRLDLNDLNCRRAKEAGVRLCINTDSHRPEHLAYMELGVAVARRGWLEKKDVLNTLPLNELLKTLKR